MLALCALRQPTPSTISFTPAAATAASVGHYHALRQRVELAVAESAESAESAELTGHCHWQ